jgi:hypothetical protein
MNVSNAFDTRKNVTIKQNTISFVGFPLLLQQKHKFANNSVKANELLN